MSVLCIDAFRDRRHQTMEHLAANRIHAMGADGVRTGILQIDRLRPDLVVIEAELAASLSRRDLQQLSRGQFFRPLPVVVAGLCHLKHSEHIRAVVGLPFSNDDLRTIANLSHGGARGLSQDSARIGESHSVAAS